MTTSLSCRKNLATKIIEGLMMSLMFMVRKIYKNSELRISTEAANLIMQYGSYFIQYDKFTYFKIGGFEFPPLYASDYLVF